jgi:hypothetical protein
MSIRRISTVNAVGPTSDHYLSYYLDPRDDPSNHPNGSVVITLSALDNTFADFAFLVDDALANTMLATGLAAINTGRQVLADVDWPQPVIGQDQDGNDIYGPAYCYSLWLKGAGS